MSRTTEHQRNACDDSIGCSERNFEDPLGLGRLHLSNKRLEHLNSPGQVEERNEMVSRAICGIERLIKASKLKPKYENKRVLALFDLEELVIGRHLGSGGFARVHEVRGFNPSPSRDYSWEEQAARDLLANHIIRQSTGECRFAVKYLRRCLMFEPNKYAIGAVDLAMEAHMMSSLDHPNILKIRGAATAGPKGLIDGGHDGYFIIVDKITETLDARLKSWKKLRRRLNRPYLFGKLQRELGKKELWREQLMVAFDIASAVEHLHINNVLHRDIKPANVGFDIDGDCKLFDFNLSKELTPSLRTKQGSYRMSSNIGTPRYMAPEVRKGEDYDLKADVYSYCLTLYAILSLQDIHGQTKKTSPKNPPKVIRLSQDEELVKPLLIDQSWPVPIQQVLEKGLLPNSSERPAMAEIAQVLRSEIIVLDGGDAAELERHRTPRRSTLVVDLAKLRGLEEMGARRAGSSDSATVGTSTEFAPSPSSSSQGWEEAIQEVRDTFQED